MTWLAFIASLVHSLAWPAGIVAVVTIMRKPIGAALNRGLRRLRAGPIEVEFEHELAEVREELSRSAELSAAASAEAEVTLASELTRLTEISPRAAVLEGFARIEGRLRERLDDVVEVNDRATARVMAGVAYNQGLISEETLRAIEGLSVLRNLAAHSLTDTISVDRARDYLVLADAVLHALRAKPGAEGDLQPAAADTVNQA